MKDQHDKCGAAWRVNQAKERLEKISVEVDSPPR